MIDPYHPSNLDKVSRLLRLIKRNIHSTYDDITGFSIHPIVYALQSFFLPILGSWTDLKIETFKTSEIFELKLYSVVVQELIHKMFEIRRKTVTNGSHVIKLMTISRLLDLVKDLIDSCIPPEEKTL